MRDCYIYIYICICVCTYTYKYKLYIYIYIISYHIILYYIILYYIEIYINPEFVEAFVGTVPLLLHHICLKAGNATRAENATKGLRSEMQGVNVYIYIYMVYICRVDGVYCI